MREFAIFVAAAFLASFFLGGTSAHAATNLNSSRSNANKDACPHGEYLNASGKCVSGMPSMAVKTTGVPEHTATTVDFGHGSVTGRRMHRPLTMKSGAQSHATGGGTGKAHTVQPGTSPN